MFFISAIIFPGRHFSLYPPLSLIGVVLSAVHHAETIAHRVGEPFGTLVLALAVTLIEVSLIVSLMFAGGKDTSVLARDTVFAAVMIILNGMIGLSIFSGGIRFREQNFVQQGISAALTTLVAISVLTLILPNFTVSVAGPFYNKQQLLFVAIVTLILYGTFILVQNVRHRDHFLNTGEDEESYDQPSNPGSLVKCVSVIRLPCRRGVPGRIPCTGIGILG